MPRLDHQVLPWSWPFLVSLVAAVATIGHGLLHATTRSLVALCLALISIAYLPFVMLPGYSDRFTSRPVIRHARQTRRRRLAPVSQP